MDRKRARAVWIDHPRPLVGGSLVCSGPLDADEYRVGVGRIDVTPDFPVRLSGFRSRRPKAKPPRCRSDHLGQGAGHRRWPTRGSGYARQLRHPR